MITVIFEATTAAGEIDDPNTTAQLRLESNKMEGFISIETFQSLVHPEKTLSLSFWENEEAIEKWRNNLTHRQAQEKGRASTFSDYRIRIGSIVRDYTLSDRTEAPKDSNEYHILNKNK